MAYIYRTELNNDRLNCLVRESETEYGFDQITDVSQVVELFNTVFHMDRRAEEIVCVIATDVKNKPIALFEVTHGTGEASLINTREIFIRLCIAGASRFFMAHNHPSGDPSPSREDTDVTKRVREAGQLMGILCLDHLIIGDNKYFSYMENNWFE